MQYPQIESNGKRKHLFIHESDTMFPLASAATWTYLYCERTDAMAEHVLIHKYLHHVPFNQVHTHIFVILKNKHSLFNSAIHGIRKYFK
jgi:hypothetical protein